VMPRDARALCRLFPVLASVEEFARAPEIEAVENRDTLRSRAIAALRELLARIADRKPLVVVLDDMQWCCSDSARVLVDLLAGGEPPRALFIFAYRPQARQTNPALRVLRDGLGAAGIPMSELVLEPLSEAEALQLARAHAPADTPETSLRDIVRDAQGSPMLIEELLRSDSGPHGLGLDQILASRIASLSEAARTTLAYIATAGRLVEMRTLRTATGLPAAELAQAIRALEEAEVIQRAPAGDDDIALETRHDRVREVAYGGLTEAQRASYHHALGDALAARNADPEAIAEHFRLAGERVLALPFVRQAAAKAVEALAHDRAIALYRVAVELSSDDDRFPVEVALGDTLTFDGQGVAAADAYRTALAHAPTSTDAVDLRRRVAEQLLRSGRIDEGLDAIEDVMRAANLAMPTSSRASLLFQRFRLWTRGLEVPKESKPLTRETRVALDATWSAGVALAGFDLVKSADLQTRHLRMALETGDPMRMSLGFAMEGVMLALDGAKSQERAALVIEKAEQLAQEIGDPYAMGWASGAASVLAFAEGNLRSAVTLADYAVALFQVRCVDAAWEVGTVQSWFRLRAQLLLGELAAARTEAADVERDAVRRKDLYTQTNVRLGVLPFLRLAANDVAGARTLVADTIAAWSTRGWHNQHHDALRANCMIDMYEGDMKRLRARLDEHAKHLTGARIGGRVLLHAARAAAAIKDGDLALARQLARKVAAEGNAWANAVAAGLDARVAAAEGANDATARITAAERAFTSADMPLHAAALRRLRGETTDADAVLADRGIADPARMVEILIA
jgi:eukaryotic-like serine/threonine-protein kinase